MAGGGKEGEEVATDPKLEQPLSEEEAAQVRLEAIAWSEIAKGQYANG